MSEDGLTITLSKPVSFTNSTAIIMFRQANGGQTAQQTCRRVSDTVVTLNQIPPIRLYTGGNQGRAHFVFTADSTNTPIAARVISVKPSGGQTVEITTLAEDNRVHA